MFKNAIVRKPCRNLIKGLTSANLGIPDYELASQQHELYIKALAQCGLDVVVLEADERYPDSVFVEDVALLTPHVAIITNPGAKSRKGETEGIRPILNEFYDHLEEIHTPGNLEAGDVMMVGSHFYIGLSARTNKEGARQLINILNRYDMSGSMVLLKEMLHLKTGLSYLENNNLLISGEFTGHPDFSQYNNIIVDQEDAYAANSVWINGKVLIPQGYPAVGNKVELLGYEPVVLDMSEFRKLDGGLSCLSLRF